MITVKVQYLPERIMRSKRWKVTVKGFDRLVEIEGRSRRSVLRKARKWIKGKERLVALKPEYFQYKDGKFSLTDATPDGMF